MASNPNTQFLEYQGIYYSKGKYETQESENKAFDMMNFFLQKKENGELYKKARQAISKNSSPMKGVVDFTTLPKGRNIVIDYMGQLETAMQKFDAAAAGYLQSSWGNYKEGQPINSTPSDNAALLQEFNALRDLASAIQSLNDWIVKHPQAELNSDSWQLIRSKIYQVKAGQTGVPQKWARDILDEAVTTSISNEQMAKIIKNARGASRSLFTKRRQFSQALGDIAEKLTVAAINENSDWFLNQLEGNLAKSFGGKATQIGQGAITTTIRGQYRSEKAGIIKNQYPLQDVFVQLNSRDGKSTLTVNESRLENKGIGISVKRYNLSGKYGYALGSISMRTLARGFDSINIDQKDKIYVYRGFCGAPIEAAGYLMAQELQGVIWGNEPDGPDYTSLILINGKLLSMTNYIQTILNKNNNGLSVELSKFNNPGFKYWKPEIVPNSINAVHSGRVKLHVDMAAGQIYNLF